MGIDRRSFLASAPLVGLGALRAGPGAWHAERVAAPSRRALPTIGVQIYTLRAVLRDTPEQTFEALADIGYRTVEMWGLGDHTAAERKAMLDAAGLRAVSSHVGMGAIRTAWEATLEEALTLGQSHIVCPSIGGDERDPEGLRRVADDFNRAGEAAREAGLRFGYHNHDWEFRPLAGGRSAMELLLEWCDPALVSWQMDIYWVVNGGGDPLALLERYGERVATAHVKDRTADGRMVDVGDGVLDFGRILGRGAELGMSHAFVEHDRPDDPLESVRRSWRYLRRLEG